MKSAPYSIMEDPSLMAHGRLPRPGDEGCRVRSIAISTMRVLRVFGMNCSSIFLT